MPRTILKRLSGVLALSLLVAGLSLPAAALSKISKTSKPVLRPKSPVTVVVPDLSAVALSTTSLQWNWSTGTATAGITGFNIYFSSTPLILHSSATLAADTTFYIQPGLEAGRVYTGWITAYDADGHEGSDSPHIDKFTYALPPDTIVTVDTITASNVYVDWRFSAATAYEIQCSTDAGAYYSRNRAAFVPWQTIPVLSNKEYMIRLAAINGDDEVTPGLYSAVRTFTTPPFSVSSFTAVALSSYTIEWSWPTDIFAGTGITGFHIYKSTTTPDADIPTDGCEGEIIKTIAAGTSYWIETFIDSHTVVITGTSTVTVGTMTFVSTGTASTQVFPAANSRHTRWIKAYGFDDSLKEDLRQKYTYAIAPATCTAVYPENTPYDISHVQETYVSLNWDVLVGTHGLRVGIASTYVIDRSTEADFALSLTSVTSPTPDFTVSGLDSNTKYDFRIAAINGDGEQTPDNALNPFAYSRNYRVMTRVRAPSDFTCDPLTDTAMECTWSTSTYTHPEYIEGYTVGDKKWYWSNGAWHYYYSPTSTLSGADSLRYTFDYLMTNSTHTIGIWASQTDPAWVDTHPYWPDTEYEYYHVGGYATETDGTTFATPPNDVSFDTVTAYSVGTWWLEPEVRATAYRVERSTTLGSAGPWVFVSSVTDSHFNDTGLLPSTTYSYRIGAINQLGLQTLGLAEATTGFRRDYSFIRSTVTKHVAPSLYGVATGTGSIMWSWTDTVSGVTSYNLYAATGGVIAAGLGAATVSYEEFNLAAANAQYARLIRSVASDGEGDFSSATVRTLSNPPASVTVTSSGTHSLSIGWTANESARYRIDRSTDLVSWTGLRAWGDAFTSAVYGDTGLRYNTSYYYAVLGYNDDGFVSVSSAITAANMTLPLPSSYTVVYATSAANITAPLAAPSVAQIAVDIPAGAVADGYFSISTSAAASPAEITKSSLDAATAKLASAFLVSGSVVELHLFNAFGEPADLAAPARLTVTYADANADDILDGTSPQAPADTLNFFSLDTGLLVWNQLADTVVSTNAKTAYSDVEHFSFYALASVTLPDAFTGAALSTTSIQWSWPTEAGVDGYRLYTSSSAGYIVLASSANFYTDSGLGVNKPYTRWLKGYSGGSPTSESEHIQRYTYALPPSTFTLSQVTNTSAYLDWHFSTATAYAIECSTDGGTAYSRNRESFVPWQTISLLSNKFYSVRIGAINGDNQLTPGVYSTVLVATTPPLEMAISTAVAVSSCAITWSWSTGTVAGTGITGYRVYGYEGVVYSTTNVNISSWTETYADGAVPAANSPHMRWIKAVGLLESPSAASFTKYTYAVAPSTCGVASPADVAPDSVNLVWAPRTGESEADRYAVYYATAGVAESSADFNVSLTSSVVASRSAAITGLVWGTKHDFVIGAINGDGEQTPADALNPYAYSGRFKVITRPPPPVHLCTAVTDTILKWSWSTAPYNSGGYISSYTFSNAYGVVIATVPGVASYEYVYDPVPPLLTNSVHSGAVAALQAWAPDCSTAPANAACYYFFGSSAAVSTGATFATPPNDLAFATVTARGIGISWLEPEVHATAYRVERSTTPGEQGPWAFVSTVTGTQYEQSGLTPSTTYSYRIGAINQLGVQTLGLSAATDGNRRDYSFVSSTMTKHAAPALYGVATATGSITWWWTDTVQGVTAYNFYTSSGVPIALGLSSSTTVYYETNLSSANARYNRWVRSTAWDGEGDYSEASVMTLSNPPSSVAVTSSGTHTLSLGWTANESARYKVDRSTDLATWTGLRSWTDVFVSTYLNDTYLRYSTTYYYAVSGYNDDGYVSVSSAVTAAAMTLPLPANCTLVYATSAVTATAPLPAPSLSLLSVAIPLGTPDGYFSISTSASVSPREISKADLDAATGKLRNSFLISPSIVELNLYDVYGQASSIASAATVTMTYVDADADDNVDGTAPQANADNLSLFDLDTGALVWNQRQNSAVSKTAKTVSSSVDHLSFYALGSVIPGAFSAEALSTTSIKWSWSAVSGGIDAYHLFTSSAAGYVVVPASISFYTDTGLEPNKAYTRWVKVSSASAYISESAHVQKYTYALPPHSIAVSSMTPISGAEAYIYPPYIIRAGTTTATSMYLEIPEDDWFPNPVYATAYQVQCSTNGGADYYSNRAFFVPWQTIPLMSNSHYMIRIAAINGDNEVTPGIYSATRTFTTPPLRVSSFTAVAVSSYSIQWQWPIEMFSGTGIAGFRIYRSTTASEETIPTDGFLGTVVQTLAAGTSFWTEVFVDSPTHPSANSQHTRWIKAFGELESYDWDTTQKYTYAVAPASCSAVYLDPPPDTWIAHVYENSVNLMWYTETSTSEPRVGIASSYMIEHSTVPGFTAAVTTSPVGAPPQGAAGLTDNTKYDFRIGAVNGDGEQTPANAQNPYAYSQAYKIITTPRPPSDYSCPPYTDTSVDCIWSTSTYTNPTYLTGYWNGNKHERYIGGELYIYWDPLEFQPGVESNEYKLDYLLTNSTHTLTIWVSQTDPDWSSADPDYDPAQSDGDSDCQYHYCHWGSGGLDDLGSTFATPPNDVSFDTIAAHSIGVWWKEPEVPATQYRVERSTNLGEIGPWVFVSSVSGNHYNDLGVDISTSGLTASTTYSYRIGAINKVGIQTTGLAEATSGQRRDYSFVQSTMTVQRPPTLYALANDTFTITWSWTNDVSGVLRYNMYDSTNGVLMPNLSASATYWIETGLTANTRYTRRLRSVTSMGESDYYEASTVTYPSDPSALAFTAAGMHSLAMEWSGNGGTAYRLSRSTDMASWTPVKVWSDLHTSTGFAEGRLRLATTYYYAVDAFNQLGALSFSSASATGRTSDLAPIYSPVYSTATVAQSTTVALAGFGWITVQFPAGSAPSDGYLFVSSSASTIPIGVSKANLDAAETKFLPSRVVTGSVGELYFYDLYGSTYTGNFTSPARVSLIYTDADDDGALDGASPQIQAATLKFLNLDTVGLAWTPLASSRLDSAAKSVYSDISHFSFYAAGSIITVTSSLTQARAYPNPYKPGSTGIFGDTSFGEGVVFEGLTARARIKIYSLIGALVAEVSDDDGDGRALWNARNKGGDRVASGLYFYVIATPGDSGRKTGKLTIIR